MEYEEIDRLIKLVKAEIKKLKHEDKKKKSCQTTKTISFF